MAKSPFSCYCMVSNLKRDLQREVTRVVITPHKHYICSRSASDKLFPTLSKVLPATSVTDCQLTASLSPQLCCLHPLCLEVPLQFWAGDVYFGWVHFLLCNGKRRMSSATGRKLHFHRDDWKSSHWAFGKRRVRSKSLCRLHGCGLGMAFLNREMNATLSWKINQNQQRESS